MTSPTTSRPEQPFSGDNTIPEGVVVHNIGFKKWRISGHGCALDLEVWFTIPTIGWLLRLAGQDTVILKGVGMSSLENRCLVDICEGVRYMYSTPATPELAENGGPGRVPLPVMVTVARLVYPQRRWEEGTSEHETLSGFVAKMKRFEAAHKHAQRERKRTGQNLAGESKSEQEYRQALAELQQEFGISETAALLGLEAWGELPVRQVYQLAKTL